MTPDGANAGPKEPFKLNASTAEVYKEKNQNYLDVYVRCWNLAVR